MVIFHCYVSSPEGREVKLMAIFLVGKSMEKSDVFFGLGHEWKWWKRTPWSSRMDEVSGNSGEIGWLSMGLYDIIWGIYAQQWNCKEKHGDFGDGKLCCFFRATEVSVLLLKHRGWLGDPFQDTCIGGMLEVNVNPGLINHGLWIMGYSSNSHNLILKWYPPNWTA